MLAVALTSALGTLAQDKIYRKSGKVVEAKVLEVGSEEIKYRVYRDTTGPLYTLATDKIKKIVYENGREESFTVDIKDPEYYEGQLRRAIKVDFIAPLTGYSQFSYEKSTGVGKGYELTLGIIGAGKSDVLDYYDNTLRSTRKNPFGIGVSAGYKFNKLPDFLFGRTRLRHIMQGSYVKPSIILGNYSENQVVYKQSQQYVVERHNTSFGALHLELGKQWVFGDRFLVNLYYGFGYGFDNKYNDNDSYYYNENAAYNYMNSRLGSSPGFSVMGGIKLGWLIK